LARTPVFSGLPLAPLKAAPCGLGSLGPPLTICPCGVLKQALRAKKGLKVKKELEVMSGDAAKPEAEPGNLCVYAKCVGAIRDRSGQKKAAAAVAGL
jgi:hypothetical protein